MAFTPFTPSLPSERLRKIQDIVDTTFPQILFPLDTEIESLINFADKIYQRGNIILLIDPDGVILNAGELNLVHKILNEINSSSIGTTKNLNIFGKKDSNNYGFRVESKNCLEYQDILKQQEIVKLDDVILPENSRNLVKLNVTFTDLIIILFIVLIRTLFSGTLVGIVAAPIMCIACAFFALLLGVYINIYFIALIFIFTFIFAYYTLFETLYNEEITKKKIIILSRQISDQPNNLQLFFQRGYAYLSIEKYDIAMGDFNRFIEIQPANIAAYYSIIFEYEKKRKYDNCLIFCKKLIQNIPQYHEIYLKMAELKCKKGESKSAILDLDSFLKLNFRNIRAHQQKAEIYYTLNDYVNAITSYNYLIELDPSEPYNFYRCACCFEKLNDIKKAKDNYQIALKLFEKYKSTNSYYSASKQRLEEINSSLTSVDRQNELKESNIDYKISYENRYEDDFINWYYKADYEPDNVGSYEAWIEEKNNEMTDYFNDDDE